MRKGTDIPIRIIRVADGDGLVVAPGSWLWSLFTRQRRVRLYGIDAPELDQPLGPESKVALNRITRVWMRMKVMDFDRYGRVVGLVYRSDPMQSLNRQMVAMGLAFYYRRYGGAQFGIKQAEDDAQQAGLGLWRDPSGGVRPWDHRAAQRTSKPTLGGGFVTAAVVVAALILLAVILIATDPL